MKCRMRGLRTDFSSANKLKEKFDQKIEDLKQPQASNHAALHQPAPQRIQRASALSKEEMDQLYAKLNKCKIKVVTLSLIHPFADQFIDQSRPVQVVSERSVCYKLVQSLALSCL